MPSSAGLLQWIYYWEDLEKPQASSRRIFLPIHHGGFCLRKISFRRPQTRPRASASSKTPNILNWGRSFSSFS